LGVTADWNGSTAKLFLHRYDEDRRAKKYSGRTKNFMRNEMSTALAYKDMVIIWGVHENKSVAAIMLLLHGRSASYRLGWTTEPGRQCNAHNLLLWEAVKLLKEKGIAHLDLVGVEPSRAKGLTAFKMGMGGETFKTLGLFS
jgi:lipid II:glycine glycyltransferase (peptidoglycan interpeptide bridge formation enzyme)